MNHDQLVADKSLSEIHSTININHTSSFLKRLFYFTGPAFMVSVGYMDPGNWATDLAGGSQFGYKLIWIILLANMMAILFQTLSARLGIVYGRDLAQACRDHYPKPLNYLLWIICEIAIAACDLAEVIGSAVGLYLLFGIPLFWGVIITAFDVLILMLLLSFGIRKMEAFILALVATIGVCFAFEMFLSKPALNEIARGFIPSVLNGNALYIGLGIIGATVMPHNLYLHSALVQSRNVKRSQTGLKEANRFNLIDSIVALNGAFFVNAAILILAASVFFSSGHSNIASIIDAHALLAPLLGNSFAPIAFGIALLAAGQSSTITGTFAGQIVMEGFIGLKMRPWLRRIITRLIAIIPTIILIKVSGDKSIDALLILSQVILSLQLPFAIIPLLHFTSDKNKMGEFASKYKIKILAWIAASLIIFLNLKLVLDFIGGHISDLGASGIIIRFLVLPIVIFLVALLLWIAVEPYFKKEKLEKLFIRKSFPYGRKIPFTMNKTEIYKKIGIALEGKSRRDEQILKGALPFLKMVTSELYLIHCVESVAGRFIGGMVADESAQQMNIYLENISEKLKSEGFTTHVAIGGGEPENEIARICRLEGLELLIVGSHGHKFIKDIVYGSTANEVRHKLRIPVLAIPIDVEQR
ncbi:MAG TPA: Nramp family divalent metal transporter [Ignavibacteriaceae bacterium]|nr:Nramp family divalent metal transporter [Ignavibacteriaceae bacterium]